MRPRGAKAWVLVMSAAAVALAASGAKSSRGQEPAGGRGGLGRLFRQAPATRPEPAPAPSGEVSLPAENGPTPRIRPQPRSSRAVTEADPVLVKVGLLRSDDGKTFGEFLEVFADGTVLDAEGVHHAGPAELRGLINALQDADAGRLRGHCGGPPTDFVEQVHLTVFERSFGRLRANHFSYSGNTKGCNADVQKLHAAINAFHDKLRSPLPAPTSGPSTAPPPVPGGPALNPPISAAPAIPLSPGE